jgi:hypothetical protein
MSDTTPPAPTPEPAPAETPRPSWPELAVEAARATWDVKLIIPVLIGLVSVTSAVAAWRASQLGEYATDKDRQAIAETVRVQQDAAGDELTLQDARTRVADHAAALAAATVLDQQADRLGGDAGQAAAEEAQDQRIIAARALQGGPTSLALDDYVSVDPDTGAATFDAGRMEDDLRALSAARSQVNPSQTVREGNRLRSESQRYDGWTVPLIAAVVVLTLAQIARRVPIRIVLACLGSLIWIVATIGAFGNGY